MPSITSRIVTATAITLILSLVLMSADALAKTRAKPQSSAPPASQAAAYSAPPTWSGSRYGGGNVRDNTAGWGDVGAR